MDVGQFNDWIAQVAREAGRIILQHPKVLDFEPLYRYAEIPSEVEFLFHWEPDGSGVLGQKFRLSVDKLRADGAAAIVFAAKQLME